MFKNCAQFTNFISEVNITWVDNAKDIAVVMTIYILREYCDNYSKIYGSLRPYYRDEPSVNENCFCLNKK